LRSGAAPPALQALQQWAHPGGHDALVPLCAHYAADTPIGCRLVLPGPTGESNVLRYRARGRVLCLGAADVAVLAGTGTGDLAPSADPAALAGSDEAPDLLFQLAAVAATGNRALCVEGEANRQLVAALPPELRALVDWTADWIAVRGVLAARAGARISLLRPSGGRYELYRMVAEQVLTINTAAAGGNATLMSLQPA
jgi:RHH-type proline utilization regulon transcriptional repressor/proline dehydrogenase/delta 1-pyrroline-5-carboxylate dehydrogenase